MKKNINFSNIDELTALLKDKSLSSSQHCELEKILDDYQFHVGRTWRTISKEQKQKFLSTANAVDGRTGNEVEYENGDCIIDFHEKLYSVEGKVVDSEIVIDNDAILYDPHKGIIHIAPQTRWEKKAGFISKSYKLNKTLVEDFSESCKQANTTQAKQLSKMMKDFIIDVRLNKKLEE